MRTNDAAVIRKKCEEIWSSVWINNPLRVAQWEIVPQYDAEHFTVRIKSCYHD